MKKIFLLTAILTLLVVTTGCSSNQETDKIKIYTTLFPQYDFAKQIGGEFVDVEILLKPGVEPHSYEPTAMDIIKLNTADIFIYTNAENEPWVVDSILNTIDQDQTKVVNASVNIVLIEAGEHEDEDEDHEDEGEDEHLYDPHVWTTPLNAIEMLETVLQAIIEIDPENEAYYTTNATNYVTELNDLHQDFVELFANATHRTIIHGGHDAFGYFEHTYDVELLSPYEGFSPNEELKSSSIIKIVEYVELYDAKVIYHEELVEPKAATIIKNELQSRGIDIELRLLHGAHNLSKEELDNGTTYLSIMKQNYENLKLGFDTNE